MNTMQDPTEGRIVKYTPLEHERQIDPRPQAAVVTYVWSGLLVNLYVFGPYSPYIKTSVEYGDEPGQWHWPTYVPPVKVEG